MNGAGVGRSTGNGERRAGGDRAGRRFVRRVFLVALLVVTGAGSAAGERLSRTPAWVSAGMLARVTLPSGIQVTGERLRLGDIATIEAIDGDLAVRLDGLDLGHAPAAGVVRPIGQDYVRLMLRKEGLPAAEIEIAGAERVAVERLRQRVSAAWIRERLKGFLGDEFGASALETLDAPEGVLAAVPGTDLELVRLRDLRTPGDLDLPDGELDLRIAFRGVPASGERVAGRVLLDLVFAVDGTVVRKAYAQIEVDRFGPVLRIVRRVERGEPVGPDDVEVIVENRARVHRDAVSSLESLPGRVAATTLVPGRTLTDRMLAVPDVVRRGDLVRARVSSGGLEVTALVEALEGGSPGDRIRARNAASGKEITVRIIDRQTAMLEFSAR